VLDSIKCKDYSPTAIHQSEVLQMKGGMLYYHEACQNRLCKEGCRRVRMCQNPAIAARYKSVRIAKQGIIHCIVHCRWDLSHNRAVKNLKDLRQMSNP
jgi:hypothetical protein